MKNLLIYPFDSEALPIVRYENMLMGYDGIKLVSPCGWGRGEEYYETSQGRIYVNTDFEEELDSCTDVLICNSNFELDLEEFIIPQIVLAIKKEKKVIVSRKLSEEEIRIIRSLGNQNQIQIICDDRFKVYEISKLRDISTPIIAVCGLFEGIEKFEMQLYIKQYLEDIGCTVEWVGTREECVLFGGTTFPEFMYSKQYCEKEKIMAFNQFIKEMDNKNVDVIVLGIPGELFPITKKLTGNFGMTALEIFMAVKTDCNILLVPYEEDINNSVCKIKSLIENRFLVEIDYVCVSNKVLDVEESERTMCMEYNKVQKKHNQYYERSTFDMNDTIQKNLLLKEVIKQMKKYGKIKLM